MLTYETETTGYGQSINEKFTIMPKPVVLYWSSDNWGIGKFFDVVVASAETGCAKPDLKIFFMALDKAGCEPADAVMVGDRLDNDIIPASSDRE